MNSKSRYLKRMPKVEVPEAYADRVGVVFRNSIRKAGKALDLRCPLDGEYQIGDNWSSTH